MIKTKTFSRIWADTSVQNHDYAHIFDDNDF